MLEITLKLGEREKGKRRAGFMPFPRDSALDTGEDFIIS